MYSLPDEIEKEFKLLLSTFDSIAASALQNKELTKLYSKHNLYEIEPFYAELANQVIAPDQELFISSENDFDPEKDDLYEYHINMDTRKVFFKKWIIDSETSYETIFEYNNEYYKSTTIFINQEGRKAIKLCYLYFGKGMPQLFYECTDYGIIHKAYHCEGDKLTGYQLKVTDSTLSATVKFLYEENRITKIVQETSSGNKNILFEAGIEKETRESVLKRLENFLTEQIANQILENVNIKEAVYCILMEYSMQHPFPPTVAIGLISELEDDFEKVELWERYNAPDMQYFSEDDRLYVDLFPESIQSTYLYTDKYTEDISWNDEEKHEAWAKEVFEVYLNICKRLMHFDFSACFPKSPHFLVMAREFEECNEAEFYKQLSDYKKTNEL